MRTTADAPQGGAGFSTFREVCRMTTLSRRTVYRYLARKIFPEPRRLPGGKLIWRTQEVLDWMNRLWAGADRA
ncbi:helix-turn-helix transcriptional regulator [Rhizobium leguminosarum]|uniref:helix-turn-helix transcriptional regulator n=1 Tax=Rhizobium leguminosarum TaxID=384 RepID=UPI003F952762